ncbi:MAG: hypothetical protein M1436_05020 [Acidobacteria bacterium]|nr:hypothetical protein [Acidobacteriota bacterium]
MLRHLRNPKLLATYAVGFCVLFCLLGTFTYVNFYLAAPPFRLSVAELGLLFVVYLVGAVITPLGILLTLMHALPVVTLGLTLCCTGVFVAQSAASSYIGTVAHDARAAAVGLYVMFYYACGSLGAAVPGQFWKHGGWPVCAGIVAAVQVLTIALALAFWKPQPRLLRGETASAAIAEG